METYIRISNLNDFIFCPRSIYFHGLYSHYSNKNYHGIRQTKGKMAHESIDQYKYSTSKRYQTSLDIYSEKYHIGGKIDVYDSQEKQIIERKRKISKLYDGYYYQIYAQYFCMIEMGFEVNKLCFHSLVNNKRFAIELPSENETEAFEKLLKQVRSFNLAQQFKPNINKCNQCIYRQLCDYG